MSLYSLDSGRVASLLGAVLVAVAVLGCKAQPAGGAVPSGSKPPVPVKIATVGQQVMPIQFESFGSVEPIHSVQIKAQVGGIVMQVLFEEGSVVEEGQVLFVIDKRPFEVDLRQAKANLAKAQALLEQAHATLARDKAQAANSRSVLARDKELIAKGMVSNEKFDQSTANAEAAVASLAADEANIKSAVESISVSSAAVEEAELQLAYCEIRSPIKGKTGAIAFKVGNLVKANDSQPLVTINQVAPIYVSFAVSEKLLPDILRYQSQGPLGIKAWASQGESQPTPGQLTFVDNKVDNTVGMIAMKGTFANVDNALWPGQYVRLLLEMSVQKDAIVAPAAAILIGQQGPYAYVVNGDLKTELRKVSTGQTVDQFTVIQEGLQAGEKVIVDGQSRVVEGGSVTVIEAPAKEQSPAA